jgi:pimeloyl-ACP methyl ester carboxylesterase
MLAVQAQIQPIYVQNNTFNSSFTLTPSQISTANLSATLAHNIQIAVNFERTNWATGSVFDDAIYVPPAVNASTPPGTLLAVENFTNTDLYTLAPGLALSRILFVTETLNGTNVPASAYILWPWQAKTFRGSPLNVTGVPIVGWAHGTSGVHGECAPSHIRNLWYQYSAPYILALQGYAVVAPDYAGLGVNHTAEGEDVVHEYLANPAGANDVLFAVQAAQAAFPELSKHFVTMGHSQGGGVAWSIAERQRVRSMKGYLGTVAGSPVTNITTQLLSSRSSLVYAKLIAQGLRSIFPDLRLEGMFTEQGVRLFHLSDELQACNSVDFQLFTDPEEWLRPDFLEKWYFPAFTNLTAAGGHPISGPMLVLQGTADSAVNYIITTFAVETTCALYPDSWIEYVVVEGSSHVPSLYASQQIWLEWIADRFAGVPVEKGCSRRNISSLRPVAAYQAELEYYLQIALEPYVVA